MPTYPALVFPRMHLIPADGGSIEPAYCNITTGSILFIEQRGDDDFRVTLDEIPLFRGPLEACQAQIEVWRDRIDRAP